MRYYILIIDNDVLADHISDREHTLVTVTDESVAGLQGDRWLAKYPNDIVMLVEVPEKYYHLHILKDDGESLELYRTRDKEGVVNAGGSWAHWTNDIVMLVEEDG